MQALERERIPKRMGQGDDAGGNPRVDVSRPARQRGGEASARWLQVEIYSITGHKPGDVEAVLTAHYLPRDARGQRTDQPTLRVRSSRLSRSADRGALRR